MTIKAPVRRTWSRSRPRPEPIPDFAPVGPRTLRFASDERPVCLGMFVVSGALALFGLGVEIMGPAKANGIGVALLVLALVFAALIWLFAWRPMVASRTLFREGHYVQARVVRFECPWWSQVLKALRPFMAMASRAAMTAEAAHRLTLEIPDGQGGTRQLERIIWRAFANSLPRHGQEVGVFHDPERSDRFLFATDLKRMGVEVVEVRKD